MIQCRNRYAGMQMISERCRAMIYLPFPPPGNVCHDRTRAYKRDKAVFTLRPDELPDS